MKTLHSFIIQMSMFSVCSGIWGYIQPQPITPKLSYEDKVFKKCQEGIDGIRTNTFLDQDTLLCFGLKVFLKQFPGNEVVSENFGGVEKKSDRDFCKNFEEMRLTSTPGKRNESVEVYNLQFRDKGTCERACVDVMGKVNPICSIILLLSHNSKGNTSGNETPAPSSTVPDDKPDNDDNEVSNVKLVSGQTRKVMGQVPNAINDQQPKANDAGGLITAQNTEISTQVQSSTGHKLMKTDKSHIQKVEKISQEIKSALPNDEAKLSGEILHTSETGVGSEMEKSKMNSEQKTLVPEGVKTKLATNDIHGKKDPITQNTDKVIDSQMKMVNSAKEQKKTTVKAIKLVTKNENQEKSDLPTGLKSAEHSSAVLPESSVDKFKQVDPIGPKSQENPTAGEESSTPMKGVGASGLENEESVSQVQMPILESNNVDNDQKSQADKKETDNPQQEEAKVKINSKTKLPESNIDKQKTDQNNEEAYTNVNAETAPQLGGDDAKKTVSENIHFPSNTGDSAPEVGRPFSVDAGESNDNTEYISGGGTEVDYVRTGSDPIETGKNDIDAGNFRNKYEDDDSHFFAYFMTTMVFCIVGYLLFHNKQKILALALEGRARRGRRRPNTSGYRKLDSNLEEAISSSKSASVTQVIY